MLDADQRRLLGDFIRAHRERARPDVAGGRRRTPGLRREELAARAGISATWCAWIEQGRPVQASPEALGRIAMALSLTPAERAYLFELAGRIDPDAPARPETAPASLQAAIAAFQHPAYGLDCCWNACIWNAAAAHLFCGWLDGGRHRNLLRFVFLDAAARDLLPDWEERARRLLCEFRSDYAHMFRDARVRRFIDDLRQESPFFAQAWAAQDVLSREGGLRVFNHPQDGRVLFEQHSFTPSDAPSHKLVLLLPAG
ncbi:helix-turn-helix transcriptional regulator [Methylocystis sp. MJC1]|jgi:transcriptional regulator with XRE-family HTH domain|uniref:helix-turn-helix transcriptional regulator n=1 Tax=Methylocystis sp. MJC1 TaxID=2654282 RepID=UPI0013ED72A9|nr:helix-turn-helix transcriptional regulator [Methylocystis sp. MJC1]KAF2991648.1 hypothetical protein MJC1_01213 [Methylocystis sp. MJC1]MBU6527113.1 helix-turn-helix domain-containing protein [Methylocystis sp. MJC1]UZX13549.1 helix-turn-helix transcriptional regulator [Methylocystis sp. MJC1]